MHSVFAAKYLNFRAKNASISSLSYVTFLRENSNFRNICKNQNETLLWDSELECTVLIDPES